MACFFFLTERSLVSKALSIMFLCFVMAGLEPAKDSQNASAFAYITAAREDGEAHFEFI